ncbi:hypothetical protein [Acetobacter tropicalis]|uniref:Transposase n=1 Tax=Acetobacter tropicalis TaxID=104102 RepID=A0A291PGW6_9PROT|nr:hypothetical protein [Acetobacter tropicalis]ATJ90712.1 hypothetical protein CIW82_08445 [Acetobacter tropicalis]
MAREKHDRHKLDRAIRRMARCGLSVKKQALELGVCERIVYERRQYLGIRRKTAKQEQSAHA